MYSNRSSRIGFLLLGGLVIFLLLIVFFSQQQQITKQYAQASTGMNVSVGFDIAFDRATTIPWKDLTQVNLFTIQTTANSTLDTSGEGISSVNVPQWVANVHANHKLALITIGGIADQNWQNACNDTYRNAFVTNLINYMKSNGFDGIDLDIEDDAWAAINPPVAPWDTCVQTIANAAHATTTAAGTRPIVSEDVTTPWMGSYLKNDVQYVDQFNLMTYGDTCGNNCSSFASDIQSTYTQGIPKSKMVLGIDLIDNTPQQNNPTDCGNIANYSIQQGLMGTMVWDIHEDSVLHNGSFPCFDSIGQYTSASIPTVTNSAGGTMTPTQKMTTTLTPTIPANTTAFTFSICPHGIANCGDNANPNSGGNAVPRHSSRDVTLIVSGTNGNQVASAKGVVTYDNTSQNYQGTISVPSISTGQYLIFIKMDGFLEKQIPGIVSVTQKQTISLPAVALVNGDINNDNQLDIQDYNILISCFGSKQQTASCITPSTTSSPGADMNDDGAVDGVDYNLFLRELSVQRGAGGEPTPTFTPSSTPTPTTSPTNTLTPIPVVSSVPIGTKQTITAYGWDGSAVYQPLGSPWWTLNDAWGNPPPNTQAIDYYQNTFPNNTTLRWTYGGSGGNVLGYPEIIIGDQNGQTLKSPNGVEPAWYGKTIGSLSRFVISWDTVINAQNGDNWDILFENHMNGHETGIFLKDPGWVTTGNHFSNLGGISGIGVPNCWATGSFCIVPDGPLNGTPMLKGSIDLLPIFKWAIANGWMSSNEPVYGWEFGVEPTNGSGSVTFNSLSLDIQ